MLRVAPRLLVLVCLTALISASSQAQPPQMARDIRTEPVNDVPWLTGPYHVARFGDLLYVIADDGIHGFELWRTDGTTTGTELVADVCPGQCSGMPFGSGATAGERVFFVADDGVHGRELWATDGTAGGTQMVRDIHPSGPSAPEWLTPLGDRLVFTARDEAHGRELWISDGTEEGTVLLEDLNPGSEESEPSNLLVTQGRLFFNAWDPVHGREPWTSDGTPGAAVLLGDLTSGTEGSVRYEQYFPTNPREAAAAGGLYFFVAHDGPFVDTQLWVSDGTTGGTIPLTRLDGAGRPIGELTVVGTSVYFVASDPTAGSQIWRSDGTVAGTERVTNVQPGFDARVPRGLTAVGSRLFFADTTEALGTELWVTDGTALGTSLVADIAPGSASSVNRSFAWSGGWPLDEERILFFADDTVHGAEPWISDGTAEGTFLLKDVAPGDLPSHFALFGPFSRAVTVGGGLAFFAWNRSVGFEPWWTDGSMEGTTLVADVDQQSSSQFLPPWFPVADLEAVGDRLFFQAVDDEHGLELWVSGGTPGTTRLVKDVETASQGGEPLGSSPFELVGLQDTLVYQARLPSEFTDGGANGQAWRSDGTAEGTFPLLEAGEHYGFHEVSGVAFIGGQDGFWTSDGTPAGTRRVAEVDSGDDPVSFQGDVFFSGSTAGTGSELYRLSSDLSQATLVADAVPGPDSSGPSSLTPVGERLFFVAATPATGRELWVSDGSEEGTRMLVDLNPGAEDSIYSAVVGVRHGVVREDPLVVASGGRAIFMADDGVHGLEPWVSDGTSGNTMMLADVHPGPLGCKPQWLTDAGSRVYFRADDGASGAELWTSDGTPAGTRRVADLAPGSASSDPRFLVEVDGILYFTAWTPADGVELWRIDASGEPVLVADLVPGPGSSSPSFTTAAGRRLFFFATNQVDGYEPWSMVLPTRRLRASLSSTRSGSRVFLNIVITNPTPVDQPDAEGDELVLSLPQGLSPGRVEATGGRVEIVESGGALTAVAAAATAGHTLLWNGSIPAGATETITVELDVAVGLTTDLELQAELFFDTDADGVNDLAVLSDDPERPGEADPTVLEAIEIVEVPALGSPGALFLISLLIVGALWRLRLG